MIDRRTPTHKFLFVLDLFKNIVDNHINNLIYIIDVELLLLVDCPGRKRRHLYGRKRSNTGYLRTVFLP
jgi:hypothetical protein